MCELVLAVSDNESQSQKLKELLQERLRYQVITAASNEDALSRLITDGSLSPGLVLIDMSHPEAEGLELLHSVRICKPLLPVILLVNQGQDSVIAKAFDLGVSDILARPFCTEQARLSISNTLALQRMTQYVSCLERKHGGKASFDDIVGGSAPMKEAVHLARQAADSATPVWIRGEAGTGKELLASAIHGESARRGNPLLKVDCLRLDEDMQELALFGGKQDQDSAHVIPGKLMEADAGTIILKNVHALRSDIQHRLQKVMVTGMLQPAGSLESLTCRARFILISTESRDKGYIPQRPSGLKQFCAMDIAVPTLRERKGDIASLANHFARMYAASENKQIRCISDAGIEHLEQQAWLGNVRELMHLIWRAVLLSAHECIEVGDIRLIQQLQPVHYENRQDSIANRTNPLLLDAQGRMKNLESIEKEVIQFALTYSGGCMTHAAKHLGIGRSTLYRRMHALKLDNYISRENQMIRPTIRISSKAHS